MAAQIGSAAVDITKVERLAVRGMSIEIRRVFGGKQQKVLGSIDLGI